MSELSQPLITTGELERLYHRVMEHGPALRRGRGIMNRGAHASPFRGQGLELADLRPYHWGDDLRHMDWRATARSGRPITKVFVDERMRHLFLAVDRSPSMAFATRGRLKAAMAIHTAAALAFAALAERETIAGAAWDGDDTVFFPTAGTLDGALVMLHRAAAPVARPVGGADPRPEHALSRLLAHLNAAVPAQASVFLISDFAGLDGSHQGALMHLAQHRAVAAVHVMDPAERSLTAGGLLRIVSPLTGRSEVIDTGDEDLRARYAEAMARRHEAIEQVFSRAGIPLLRVLTDQDPCASLEDAQWATH